MEELGQAGVASSGEPKTQEELAQPELPGVASTSPQEPHPAGDVTNCPVMVEQPAILDNAGGTAQHNGEAEATKKKRRASSDGDSDGGNKKSRLVWGPKLHARFLQAVKSLSLDNAVPMRILQIMNVEGVTREQVASHLQKYRLHLKRIAGLPPGAPLSTENKDLLQRTQDALTCGAAFGNLADFNNPGKLAVASAPQLGGLTQQSLQMQLPLGMYPFAGNHLQGLPLAALNTVAKSQAPLMMTGAVMPGLQNNPLLSLNMMQIPFAYAPVQFCLVQQNMPGNFSPAMHLAEQSAALSPMPNKH